MQSNVTRSVIQMEPGELNELLTQVQETVANDVDVNKASKVFSTANLWKIQGTRIKTKSRRVEL